MESDEAIYPYWPQSELKRRRTKKEEHGSKAIRLLLLIFFIFYTLGIIIFMYRTTSAQSLTEMTKRYENVLGEARTASTENKDLKTVKESLLTQRDQLQKEYDNLKLENQKIMSLLTEIKKQNEIIARKNKELTEDNIALQNSLKAAAAAGIKPQNFTSFRGLTSRGEIERGKYLGKFHGTAYTPSVKECGNSQGITNSGKPIIPGISLAVDGRYWPFGTVFYIKGLGYAVAMDTGSAIKGRNRFDFAVFDRKFAQTLGSRYWEVYLVKKGNGTVEELNL